MSEKLADRARLLCGLICRELTWRPDDFWSATPQEIATILTEESSESGAGLDRATLDAMMERDAHG